MTAYEQYGDQITMIIPAQHPTTLAKRGKAPTPGFDPAATVQQVYAPKFQAVLNIPLHKIHHIPAAQLNVTRLVLCANYDPRNPASSCTMGNRCKFVHADASACPQHEIHVNYAWRSADDCEYERFAPGRTLHVSVPNSNAVDDVMDSSLALKNKALTGRCHRLTHCAHYYFNRTCNLGAECTFIHAVYVDPDATGHQRAPVPTQLGRGQKRGKAPTAGRPQAASKREARPIAVVPAQLTRHRSRTPSSVFVSDGSASSRLTSPRLPCDGPCSLSPERARDQATAPSPHRAHRYRHNPYSLVAVEVGSD